MFEAIEAQNSRLAGDDSADKISSAVSRPSPSTSILNAAKAPNRAASHGSSVGAAPRSAAATRYVVPATGAAASLYLDLGLTGRSRHHAARVAGLGGASSLAQGGASRA